MECICLIVISTSILFHSYYFTLRISRDLKSLVVWRSQTTPAKKTHPTPSLFCRVTGLPVIPRARRNHQKKNPRMVTFAKVLNLHFSADTPRPLMMWIEALIFSSLQSEPTKKKQLEVGWLLYSTYFRGESRNPSETNTCIFGQF